MVEELQHQLAHINIASEYEKECADLFKMCMAKDRLDFNVFSALLMKTKLRYYNNSLKGPHAAKVGQILLYIGKKYFVAYPSYYKESVIGAYMVYVFLALQPDKRIAFLKINSRDIAIILWIHFFALTQKNYEMQFVLKKILTDVPKGYERALCEYGIVHPKWQYDPTPVDDLAQEIEDVTKMYKKLKRTEALFYANTERRRIEFVLREYD